MAKRAVCLDFDGVIHQYRPGTWKHPTYVANPPVKGIREAIAELSKDYTVIVQSARCTTNGAAEAIWKWLDKWHIKGVSEVVAEKPVAECYVDDRGLTFDGDAKKLPERVRSFKPWTDPE